MRILVLDNLPNVTSALKKPRKMCEDGNFDVQNVVSNGATRSSLPDTFPISLLSVHVQITTPL